MRLSLAIARIAVLFSLCTWSARVCYTRICPIEHSNETPFYDSVFQLKQTGSSCCNTLVFLWCYCKSQIMKDSEFQHQYDFDWDRVTSSFWKKYCRTFPRVL